MHRSCSTSLVLWCVACGAGPADLGSTSAETTSSSDTANTQTSGVESSETDAGSETGTSSETSADTETGSEPFCGDGVIDPGETCDQGPDNADEGACTSQCRLAVCGDGLVRLGVEQCDDSNFSEADACLNNCMTASCGDGALWIGHEQCDDGGPSDTCDETCHVIVHPICTTPDLPVLLHDTRQDDLVDGPGGVQLCDQAGADNQSPDWVGPGWYRIGDSFQDILAIWPPADYACGGTAGGWVDAMPAVADGVVAANMCFAFGGDPCAWSVEIQFVNCWDFWLANLPDVPDCDLRYCMTLLEAP